VTSSTQAEILRHNVGTISIVALMIAPPNLSYPFHATDQYASFGAPAFRMSGQI
jgi:hypothetical protein